MTTWRFHLYRVPEAMVDPVRRRCELSSVQKVIRGPFGVGMSNYPVHLKSRVDPFMRGCQLSSVPEVRMIGIFYQL